MADQGTKTGPTPGKTLAIYLGAGAVGLGAIALMLGLVRGGGLIVPGIVAIVLGLVVISSARRKAG